MVYALPSEVLAQPQHSSDALSSVDDDYTRLLWNEVRTMSTT